MDRESWALMLDIFDDDKDGFFSFSEFNEIWMPYTKEYKTTMTARTGHSYTKMSDLTVQTKKLIKDLLYSLITTQENFEYNKYRMTGSLVAISNEMFDFIDQNKDGYITANEFQACLVESKVKGSKNDYKVLFKLFDSNRDGKVSFNEFHSPGRSAEVVSIPLCYQ